MLALNSRLLRRRLSGQTSGSARRRARERKLAQLTREEGERIAREKREQRLFEKIELQRKTREALASYEPWGLGRAGGGAPNARGVRYTNLRVGEIYPEDELKGVCQYEACRRWASPARRRRRTPLRLREDPEVCYSETNRRTVDNDLRYRKTPDQKRGYREILDDMVDKRNKEIKAERKRDLEYERKMQTMDGPWGKPGPGGSTWRNPRDIGLNFSKSMGWTDNEIFTKLQGDNSRHRGTSLTLPKVKRDDASSDKENKPSSVGKLPSIKHKEETLGGLKECKKHCEHKQTSPREKTRRSPKKKKFVKRLPNGERVAKTIPNEPVVPPAEDLASNNNVALSSNYGDKKLTPEAAILRITGGVELVPLLARRRRIGARTLPSSDVTRPPEDSCQETVRLHLTKIKPTLLHNSVPKGSEKVIVAADCLAATSKQPGVNRWRELLNMDYLKELKNQMRVKSEKKEERRQDSAESVRQHHVTWASLWGRPGHGAPQQRGRYARNNLARLLYVPPLAVGKVAP